MVVGMVSCSQQGQRYDFTICDGTGSMTARLYVGQSNADMDVMWMLRSRMTFRTSGYTRVIGSLSTSNGTNSLNIYHMEKIDSFNAVILHCLSVLQTYLYYKSKQSSVGGNRSSRLLECRAVVCSKFERNRRDSERRIEHSGDAREARVSVAAGAQSARRSSIGSGWAPEAVRSVEGAGG